MADKSNVVIATCSCRDPKWPYVYDLLAMWGKAIGGDSSGKGNIGFHISIGSQIHYGRRDAVLPNLENGATHILWIDDDMTFPADTMDRLLAHDVDFVAANCTSRVEPVWTTAVRDGKRIKSLGQTGLMEVDQVGFGVVLTKVDMFRKIPQPWFISPHEKNGMRIGEDVFFCGQARKAGYKLYIDHDLSVLVGHIGMKVYTHAQVGENSLSRSAPVRMIP